MRVYWLRGKGCWIGFEWVGWPWQGLTSLYVLNVSNQLLHVNQRDLTGSVQLHQKTTKKIFFTFPLEQGVDIILDPIGGSNVDQNLASIAMDGRWVLYGLMGGPKASNDKFLALMLRKRVQLLSSTLRARSLDVGIFQSSIYTLFILGQNLYR